MLLLPTITRPLAVVVLVALHLIRAQECPQCYRGRGSPVLSKGESEDDGSQGQPSFMVA